MRQPIDPAVAIIVAAARNGVIGNDQGLPWRLPADLKRFKSITLGKPIVMGRKTWESIGRPLPGRDNIVVTRNTGYVAEGADVVHSLAAALERARELAGEAGSKTSGAAEIMVIGGAAIYEQALPLAERIYLTCIDADVEGDTLFADLAGGRGPAGWIEVAREAHAPDAENPLPYAFVTLERPG